MKYLMTLLIWMLVGTNALPQTVNRYLDAYNNSNKDGYLQPLADLSISGLNAGLPLSARIDQNFYVNLNISGLYIKPLGSQKTFTGYTDESFSESVSREVPTVIGANELVRVNAANGTSYTFAAGYELDFLPWAIPQLTIGGFFGTEITGRFFTYDTNDDFGKFDQLGIGIRHSIDQYLGEDFPVALNLGYQFNKSDIGIYMDLQSHYGYVQGGYTVGKLDLMVYGGYQTGDFNVYYTYFQGETQEDVEVNLKNADNILGGLGAKVQLGFFSVGAGVCGPKPLTGSINFGFRIIGKTTKEPVVPGEN